MRIRYRYIVAVLILISFSGIGLAKTDVTDPEYADIQSRVLKLHETVVVNEDFTTVTTTEISLQALTEKAAKSLKDRTFSYSTSIEEFEVLEAYTLKSDGTKIQVPEDNYQVTVNKGNGDSAAIFSDRTKVTIVFPDFEENDASYVRMKSTETEPMFPGHFAESRSFWTETAYDDVKITLDLPAAVKYKFEARGLKHTESTKKARKLITMNYKQEKPLKSDRFDFSVWNSEDSIGYAISTFMDYESIALAYGDRAMPKAVPTERVKELAREVVGGEEEQLEQAKLLYEWVSTNITYAGNCIGVGAVVPHDTDFILDNKMGDCKDHATLLQAMNTAVGIPSTQALINSGSSYSLPKIPMVSSVNHVITYYPEWDKFVDSTSSYMPFDHISRSIADKPVLLVEDYKSAKKTPKQEPGTNYQLVESNMKVGKDGSVSGDIKVSVKGRPAISMRANWRQATKQQIDDWLENAFSSQNQKGSATATYDDAEPMLSTFSLAIDFKSPEFIKTSGTNGFYPGALLSTPMSIYSLLDYSQEPMTGEDMACGSGHSIERLKYEFPEDLKIIAVPDDFEVNENNIFYKADFELNKNILTVIREVNDSTPGNVCSSDFYNKQRLTLVDVYETLDSQIIYQH